MSMSFIKQNRRTIFSSYKRNTKKILMNNSSFSLEKDNQKYINQKERSKSSYLMTNKIYFGLNSLNNNYIRLKNNDLKENIISIILGEVKETKSINNDLISQIYKRPLINVYTLLELKK